MRSLLHRRSKVYAGTEIAATLAFTATRLQVARTPSWPRHAARRERLRRLVTTTRDEAMTRYWKSLGLVGIAAVGATLTASAWRSAGADPVFGAASTITVYKDPNCGCCSRWVTHLRDAGFTVVARDTSAMDAVKAKHGVTSELASCHTAVVDGYVIEGHVPAADIQRLLESKPRVVGLAVPGMPMGSPGMEGSRTDAYDVLSFDRQGQSKVFSSH
jgi:hypothetical protein